jgi:hypothetical protein
MARAPGSDGAGIYAVRLRRLSTADLPVVEQAARRIGLWVNRLDSDPLVQGPAALFAALPRSGMTRASAAALAGALRRFRRGRRAPGRIARARSAPAVDRGHLERDA